MGLLLPLAVCMLATSCMVASLPEQVLMPSPLLLSHGCNNSDVLAVAGFALQDINSDRKDGYVLSLNRVNNVQEHRQDALGSVYYLTLDVLETDCHVLSKKAWRDCGERILHQSVYGQCKAIIYVNKPRRILYSPAYNCTLRPVSRRKIRSRCPDCPSPSPTDLSDPKVLEAATESLAKYNKESTLKQYSLFKVTRASSQWVFGPSYFVEYLIRELPCTKSPGTACILQLPDSPPVGICKGSLSKRGLEKFVDVSCNFFESQELVRILTVEEPQQKNTALTDSPSEVAPKGSVQHLPELEDEQPEDSKGKSPVEAFPVQLDLTTNPQGETLDVSFLFLGPMKEQLVVLPFPKEEQRSAECPGPAKMDNPLVLPP
ncbi:fetuin-B [Rhinolophus ferrumequinum]|uniref:Cystatin fetuin-B-type domain-containing protein n=1 Tax=Rhinolophus ferrumequinum TaxID=59479 RepID=A0A671EV90_RHIFE|nr:fetuin-B [Rhinolophus ferrumequinum]